MALTVGTVVRLNSGSPPMTVKAITHAGQVMCEWMDVGGVLHEKEFAPEMLSVGHQPQRRGEGDPPEEPD